MKVRHLALCVAATLGLQCDRFFTVSARLPLAHPIDTTCLRAGLEHKVPGASVHRRVERREGQPIAVGYDVRGGNWDNVVQVVRSDSSALLVTGYGRINRTFVRDEQDSISGALGDALIRVRDACGGTAPPAARGVTTTADDPPREAWLTPDGNRRAVLRWDIDHYVLELDTLASHPDPRFPPWVPAASRRIEKPPKGFTLATFCNRADTLAVGSVVATVPNKDRAFFAAVRSAWDLDFDGLRIESGMPDGVQCRKDDVLVPTASRAEYAAAIGFAPPPGMARIYVLQKGTDFWSRTLVTVLVDSQVVGRIDAGTYLTLDVAPGVHTVTTRSGGSSVIETVADSVYFVKVSWKKWALRAGTALHRMDTAAGHTTIVAERPSGGRSP